MADSARSIRVKPRFRVYRKDEIALGPGKAELLQRVAETGNLSQAARRMKMSYMKAWLLVQLMNRCFTKPLISLERGGSGGGRATITPQGVKVLELYREMEAASLQAVKTSSAKLRRLLRP